MNDQRRHGAPPDPQLPETTSGSTDGRDDVEGHSATIYRRRRGPYPLRHGAPLPDADDRTRGERQQPGGRAAR